MLSDATLIELHKENIEPMAGGRSVSRLVKQLNHSTGTNLANQRQEFEQSLLALDELDDPLQPYIDYIKWVHDSYPMGNNVESGLVNLLERCTSYFKDVDYYKNDVRYLKIWLEYANYSDAPIEIFVYLAKKEIGKELALFYEEFGKLLEVNEKFTDAKEIFQFGIDYGARPINRLIKSFKNFEIRANYQNDRSDGMKRVLSLKRGNNPVNTTPNGGNLPKPKRQKFNVLVDDSEVNFGKNVFNPTNSKDLGSIKLRKKENVFIPKPWNGEILTQRSILSDSNSSSQKIQVYRDVEVAPIKHNVVTEPSTTHEEINGKLVTIVKKPGKSTDRVMINTKLIYGNEEISMVEVLAKCRKLAFKGNANSPEVGNNKSVLHEKHILDREDEESHTFVIPLKDEDSKPLQTPTMTFYSKLANNEVLNMFNDAYKINDDELSETNSTNYDGFVTETFHKNRGDELPFKVTPPTQEVDNSSSPFIEQPDEFHHPLESNNYSNNYPNNDSIHNEQSNENIVDPLNENLRETLLKNISPSLDTYPGYHNTKTQFIEAIRRFRSITDSKTKLIQKTNSSIVNFCGDEIYSLKCELGQGGFGYVYLIENELGFFKALKAETRSSNWEFYILNQIHHRLIDEEQITSRIIKPESLYMYQDESFLILKYLSQGTLLDIINYYRNLNQGVDEELCIFFTVELLKIIEKLHTIGIIHGDLKSDNCMIDFNNSTNNDNSIEDSKLILIDFGRSIDLSLFPEGTQFINNWEADQQDCPAMNNKTTWSFDADYYGIAAIIHSLLFGKYIEVEVLKSGKNKLKENLKRYWKNEWIGLFDILINPYYNVTEKFPLIDELKYQRSKFEKLLLNCKNLNRIINNITLEMNKKFKQKHN